MRRWHAGGWLIALAFVAGCSGSRGGGGGGGALAGPLSLTMVPCMVEGRGQVDFTPHGDTTEIHVRAEGLPPPATYSLFLVEPETAATRHEKSYGLANLTAKGGRIDHTFTVPSQMLTQWRGIELAHVPSGSYLETGQEHPALVVSLPASGGGGGRTR